MNIDNAIWFAILAAQGTVIGLILYRRIWRTLPVFCAYCIWDVASNVAVYLVGRYHEASYFQAYFLQVALDAALMFCVLVEVAWSVLRPLRASLPRSALVLVGVLILVAGAAIWPFTALPGLVHATSKAGLLFTQLQQTASILRILFFLVLAGGSQLLSIGWRDRELQVATGLGLYSIVGLTVAVLATHQTTASQYAHLAQIEATAYFCCSIYWVVSFAQKEAERREFTPQMRSFLLAAAGAARSTRVAMTESRADKPPKQDER
ncbi:MAG: hypothetical protein WCF30_04910 [Terracidiphilus sp.]